MGGSGRHAVRLGVSIRLRAETRSVGAKGPVVQSDEAVEDALESESQSRYRARQAVLVDIGLDHDLDRCTARPCSAFSIAFETAVSMRVGEKRCFGVGSYPL